MRDSEWKGDVVSVAGLAEKIPRWRTMESAPKDQEILIFIPGWASPTILLVEWREAGECWDAGYSTADPTDPTHWMPLPEPPAIVVDSPQ